MFDVFQISQLSEQLKRSLLGRKKCETEIKNLKSELVDKQRSWKEALEKEKKLSKYAMLQSYSLL